MEKICKIQIRGKTRTAGTETRRSVKRPEAVFGGNALFTQ